MHSSMPDQPELFWWVEINTSVPRRTYCVGPFDSLKETRLARGNCVGDLYQQGARDIVARINQCRQAIDVTIVN